MDYSLKEMNEMDYDLKKMNEMDYSLKEMNEMDYALKEMSNTMTNAEVMWGWVRWHDGTWVLWNQ